MPKPYNAPMLDTVANILEILMVALTAVGLAWKYRDMLGDWYYEVYCWLFNPGKKGRNETATLNAVAVARIRVTHDPYTGEYITSRVDFDKE